MSLRHIKDMPSCPLCEDKLTTAHASLSEWYRLHVKPNFQNAHISWAYRDKVDQEIAFLNHKTKDHYPYSAHNKTDEDGNPQSHALDLFQLDEGGHAVFNPMFYAKLNAYNEEKKLPIMWGGIWTHLGDYDHFQLKKEDESDGK